ncbi:polyamine aminopropyltransferase [Sagittula stellata]|uniref:Polyamine aminopropyltransferase n=1 Tax=Sagittula stellata (strain ATCC 700073 / DSM 11524 / E-37) TaxID=388399 RepID=A3K1Q6_SAGS3|nr:polyamine aminopropyltransferase [Sagittula stellata]EBA08852.1 spermidine synthase [Sagittula stellata E-37]
MDDTPLWMREQLHGDYAQAMRVDDVLYDSQTDHQRLRVIQNETFGRVLTLDDVVQVTERDNFIYHEMLTHVPIFAHGAATRICIVGGGDGGMAREALRHKTVKHVTMVEIDPGVVEFSKRYLPTISNGAFDDPRLDLVIADGADFMKTTTGDYDVIIVDSTDPIGPGEALYANTFYADARKALKDGGIIVTQNGVPFMQGDELTRTMRAFQALFADATCYLATVPSYAGGPMAFGWGTDSGARHTDVNTLQTRFCASGIRPQYYTAEVHKAAFALPGYIRKLIP